MSPTQSGLPMADENRGEEMEPRCAWVTRDPEYIEYHDKQWGRPVYDAREAVCQALPRWPTGGAVVDHHPQAHREPPSRLCGFFDPVRIVQFDEPGRGAADAGYRHHPQPAQGAIDHQNARAYLALEAEGIDFVDYLWGFVGGAPSSTSVRATATFRRPHRSRMPCPRPSKRGFTFVGSTICYAFMQAVGMVNDHLVDLPSWLPRRRSASNPLQRRFRDIYCKRLNDVVEASGDMPSGWPFLPTIFLTNGLLPLPPCLKCRRMGAREALKPLLLLAGACPAESAGAVQTGPMCGPLAAGRHRWGLFVGCLNQPPQPTGRHPTRCWVARS